MFRRFSAANRKDQLDFSVSRASAGLRSILLDQIPAHRKDKAERRFQSATDELVQRRTAQLLWEMRGGR